MLELVRTKYLSNQMPLYESEGGKESFTIYISNIHVQLIHYIILRYCMLKTNGIYHYMGVQKFYIVGNYIMNVFIECTCKR